MTLDWPNQLLLMTFNCCALLAFIVLLRPVARRIGGASTAYRLWALLPLPLVLPLLPQALMSFDTAAVLTALVSALRDPSNQRLLGAVLMAWATGFAIQLYRLVHLYRALRTEVQKGSRALSLSEERVIRQVSQQMNVYPYPPARVAPSLASPAVMGATSPLLLLPKDFFSRYTPTEQRLMLQHELVHLKRRDLQCNLAFKIVRCLLWFLPTMAIMERLFRLDQERACDQEVIANEPYGSRVSYAKAMLKAVDPERRVIDSVAFIDNRHELTARVSDIETHDGRISRIIAGNVLLALLAVLLLSSLPRSSVLPESAFYLPATCSQYAQFNN